MRAPPGLEGVAAAAAAAAPNPKKPEANAKKPKGKRDNFLAPLPQALLKSTTDNLIFNEAQNTALNSNPAEYGKPRFLVARDTLITFLKGHRDYQMEWSWCGDSRYM